MLPEIKQYRLSTDGIIFCTEPAPGNHKEIHRLTDQALRDEAEALNIIADLPA